MTRMTRMLALTTALVAAPLLTAGAAQAESWTLSNDDSLIAYGSIKKDTIGEVNTFGALSGTVDAEGKVSIEIDLTSVETYIDIRNERMVEHVFGADNPTATLTTQVDAGTLEAMKPGDTDTLDTEAVLSLAGNDVPLEATLFVARLTDGRALVTTDAMIMLSMADLGLDGGITKLMELAKLPGITRVSPVTVRLVFDRDTQEAGAGDAQKVAAAAMVTEETPKEEVAMASAGDAKAGKKVFRKCKACHVVDAQKNRVGPHLVGIVGRASGSVEGFKYSKAMAGADLTWNAETLSAYLANPKKYMPGNKMAFPGLRKEKDVVNVIAYLESEAQ